MKLFSVSNAHVESCGIPPCIDADDRTKYFGYFQNRWGEQAIFMYEQATKRGTVRLGDAGWDIEHDVVDGIAQGAVLTLDEMMWIATCWHAATGQEASFLSHDNA